MSFCILFVLFLLSSCGGDKSSAPYSKPVEQTELHEQSEAAPLPTALNDFNDTGLSGCAYFRFLEDDEDYELDSWIPQQSIDCSTAGATYEADGIDSEGNHVPARQDFHIGRDALAASGLLEKKGGGDAGFDFTRITKEGSTYLESGDYANAPWSCVKDNTTGLIWEVKTEEGLHSFKDGYTWFRSTVDLDPDIGVIDFFSPLCHGHKEGDPSTFCNTEAYVARVNSEFYCGYNDWRLPSREELFGIMHYGKAITRIDGDYYPNLSSNSYWTGSVAAAQFLAPTYGDDYAWTVSFGTSYVIPEFSYEPQHVLLVRGGQENSTSSFQVNQNGTVTDLRRGLMWKVCLEGMTWESGKCTSEPAQLNWQEAHESALDSRFAGHDDWRLPNIKELSSIVDEHRYSPALNLDVFLRNNFDVLWSSTYDVADASYAFVLTLYSGTSLPHHQSNTENVRLVRTALESID
jgi:hypothetical protein